MDTRSTNFLGFGRALGVLKSNRSSTRLNLLAVAGLVAAAVMFLVGFALLSRSAATAAAPGASTLYLDNLLLGPYVDLVQNHLLQPLTARVNGPEGPVAHAEVVISVMQGGTVFLANPSGKLDTEVKAHTDADGYAQAWVLVPVDFTATNILAITAGQPHDCVRVRMRVLVDDYSGTGTLQINTNGIPGPWAVATRTRLLDPVGPPRGVVMFSEVTGFGSGDVFLSTELFLEPRGYSNDLMFLRLHNAESGATYQLLSTNALTVTSGEWNLGEIVTAESNLIDFEPVPVGPNGKTFYRTHQASNTVSVAAFRNATEPYAAIGDPGEPGLFRFINETGHEDVTVYYRVSGTAQPGVDYTNLSGSITVPVDPNGYVDVEVQAIADGLIEGVETVTVTLIQTNNYLIPTNGSTATILIRDSSTTVDVYAGFPGITAIESNGPPGAAAVSAYFSVNRIDSRSLTSSLAVGYVLTGTASNGVDYATLSGTVTIPSGQQAANVDLTPLTDGLPEGTETVTLTLAPSNSYLVGTTSPQATIPIVDTTTIVSIGAGLDARETNSAGTVSGVTGYFDIGRTDTRGLLPALTVEYQVSGTAINGVDYTSLTGAVTIPSGSNSVRVLVQPLQDNFIEDDETVTLTLIGTNGTYFDGSYRFSTNAASATILILDNVPTNLFVPVVTNLLVPIGIDYHQPSNCLIVSCNANSNGRPYNFAKIYTNGGNTIVTNWSRVSNLVDEVKLATAKVTANGFTNGQLFFGNNGNTNRVGFIAADGSVSNLTFATLTNDTYIRGSLFVDQSGSFGGELIAVTGDQTNTGGGVWRVKSDGTAALITNIANTHLEGVITLTNDTALWGPWAGKLLVGAEILHSIFVIATNGTVTTNFLGIDPEDFDVVPANQNLYACDPDRNLIVKLPASSLSNYVGSLAITQAGETGVPASLSFVRWNGTQFSIKTVLYRRTDGSFGHLEHITFSPIDIPPTP